jgi:3-methyladenine DNA glycosylase/8-oxoguanine DNA glycosylase
MRLDPGVLRRAAEHLERADPVMARIVAAAGPCGLELDRGPGHYAVLVEAILSQQITGKAAAAIFGRLRALAGRSRPRPEDIARLSDAELRGVGLSRQKIAYLRDLTQHVENGLELAQLTRRKDEDVITALTIVKGIGRWTAEMFLIFRLGRLDVLPVDDYGVRKAAQKAYRMRALPKPKRLRKLAEPWRPFRSVASWYLWHSLDNAPMS